MAWTLFPTKRPSLSGTTLDILLLIGLCVLFYHDPLLHPDKISLGGDGLSLFVPAVKHYSESLYLGLIPLWNSNTWMGAPFLAAFQAGALYPPNLLGLFFPNPETAVSFYAFISLVWLAIGAYIFGVRALGLERSPSLLMAIALSCSGFVGGHMEHVNQLAAISWIPWIICEALLVLRRPIFRHLLFLSLYLAMQTLAGHPQYVVYTLIYLLAIGGIYLVYYQHRRRSLDSPPWLGVVLLAVALVLGLGLSAAQILPSAELSRHSVRQLDAPARMFSYSFPPRNLVTMVFPYAYGNPANGLHRMDGEPLSTTELGMFNKDRWVRETRMPNELAAFNFDEWVCYIGIIPLALAFLALCTLFREFVVRCFLFLALLSLVLASGNYPPIQMPPYQMLVSLLPSGEHLRAPSRFLIFFILSTVVLAAMGFNQVVYYLRVRRRIKASTLGPLRLLLLVLMFADLYLFSTNQTFRYQGPQSILEEKGPLLTFFKENPGEYKLFRQMVEVPYDTDGKQIAKRLAYKEHAARLQAQRLQPNLNTLYDTQIIRGYEEGLLPTLSWMNFIEKYRRNLYSPSPDLFLMGLMNVKYIVTDRWYADATRGCLKEIHRHSISPFGFMPGLNAEQKGLKFYESPPNFWPEESSDCMHFYALFENPCFLPKFFHGERLKDWVNLEAMNVDARQADPDIDWESPRVPIRDYRTTAFQEAPCPDLVDLPDAPWNQRPRCTSSRREGSPNAFVVEKGETVSGPLIMVEGAYPGWVCKWEGGQAPMKRLNAVMMGCEMPLGAKTLEVVYEPHSFRLGLFISCVFAMIWAALIPFLAFPRRHRSPVKGRQK